MSTTAPPASPVHRRRRALVLGARILVWIVYAYVVVTEIILGLGFLLLLFGANPDASFVAWAYRSLERAMEPFRGMFTPIELGLGGNDEVGAVLDTSILFAMLVYAIVAWFLSWLLEQVSGYLTDLDAERQKAAGQAPYAQPSSAATATYSTMPTSGPPPRPPGVAPGPPSAPPPRPPGAAS